MPNLLQTQHYGAANERGSVRLSQAKRRCIALIPPAGQGSQKLCPPGNRRGKSKKAGQGPPFFQVSTVA